jgi:hypothetical protein
VGEAGREVFLVHSRSAALLVTEGQSVPTPLASACSDEFLVVFSASDSFVLSISWCGRCVPRCSGEPWVSLWQIQSRTCKRCFLFSQKLHRLNDVVILLTNTRGLLPALP